MEIWHLKAYRIYCFLQGGYEYQNFKLVVIHFLSLERLEIPYVYIGE